MSTVWRFTGPPENWVTGLSRGYWAVNENNKGIWEQIQKGDIALLHSTASSGYSNKTPSCIIGYAIIGARKFTKNELWWIQEIQQGANEWPYVFSLDKYYLFGETPNVDFSIKIEDKTPEEIKGEIEEITSFGIPIKTLNARASELSEDVPKFPVNGSCSRVNTVYEELILDTELDFLAQNLEADDFSEVEKRYGETLDEKLAHMSDKELHELASKYENDGVSHRTVSSQRKMRRENAKQKRIVAKLENYTCQVCSFKCEYKKASGKTGWIIEIDHINPKKEGEGEELKNLWALCPNCHTKKTRGVITINVDKKKITENGNSISIRDNHLFV